MNLQFFATLCPSFPHFLKFAQDPRLQGLRINSAMVNLVELEEELNSLNGKKTGDLYFDIKGRQLRITEAIILPTHLELKLNHKISVQTPCPVLFKAGADWALLNEVKNGNHLIFDGGPEFLVKEGESLHIRHPSFQLHGPLFSDFEIKKIERVVKFGFKKYFLSYVESTRDIDEFREYVGKDSEIVAKIETVPGLDYVVKEFRKENNLSLMAARGDLFVEVNKPHEIVNAMRTIIEKDPQAFVGSRLLLSLVNKPVPECNDISDLAWLYDLGYRRMMLCDELCLKDDLLSTAVNVLESFRKDCLPPIVQPLPAKKSRWANIFSKRESSLKDLWS